MITDKIKARHLDESLLELINKPSVSSWNDLTDRPFGETEGEVEKVYLDFNGEWFQANTSVFQSNEIILAEYELVLGNFYTITFNENIIKNCECTEFSYVGHTVTGLRADIDENISLKVIYFPQGISGFNNAMYMIEIFDDTIVNDYTYTASVKVTGMTKDTVIKRLNGKYLPEGYPYEEGGMVEIASGIITEDGEGGMFFSPLGLEANKEYIITWNGVEYSCVANEVTEDGLTGIIAGNSMFITGVDNGIPFVLMEVPTGMPFDENGPLVYAMFEPMSKEVVFPITYSIITDSKTIHTIDPKFLPLKFIESNGLTELLSGIITDDNQMSMYIISPPKYRFELGEIYIVNWNGIEYKSTAELYNYEGMNVILIGNKSALPDGGEDTGEPFFFMILTTPITTEDGLTLYGVVQPYGDDIPEDSITYSVLGKGNDGLVLNPECIKDMYYEKKEETTFFNYNGTITSDDEAVAIGLSPMTNGDICIVNINGVDYNCVVSQSSLRNSMIKSISLTGISIDTDVENGKYLEAGFISPEIAIQVGLGNCIYVLYTNDSNLLDTEISISVTGNKVEIKKIDPKFLPDELFNKDDDTDEILPISKGGTGATTASEALTNLGIRATASELNYVDGVTSNIQTQLNSKPGLKTTVGEVFNDLTNNTATGTHSHAEGQNTKASNNGSHAEGYATQASGQAAHAEGRSTTASGGFSHAEGLETKASGQNAHAEGVLTIASGADSHAEGYKTIASGENSHAEGYETKSYGFCSHTEGSGYTREQFSVSGVGGSTVYTVSKLVYTTDIGKVLMYNGTVSKIVSISDDGLSITLDKTLSDVDLVDTVVMGVSGIAYGGRSHAEGWGVIASGENSHAEGLETKAYGENSHAEGSYTKACGSKSHAEGYGTDASGENSHAEGYYTIASGAGSHAEGESTTASGDRSHAEGRYTIASGESSHTEGSSTTASGIDSHAEGYSTTASGGFSHAEGRNTTASGTASHTEGEDTTAYGGHSHAEGCGTYITPDFTITGNANATVYTVSALTSDIKVDVCLSYNNIIAKIVSVSEDDLTITLDKTLSTTDITDVIPVIIKGIAYGVGSHTEGRYTTASGQDSHAEGQGTTASGFCSHAEGGYYTTASGKYSHAEGYQTTASGDYSHAEGQRTTASGENSHGEGKQTNASGKYSHAEGGATTASGENSHAEGSYTTASGDYSHAEGYNTKASGKYSHAEGVHTTASGEYSHAEGWFTRASSNHQHVQGRYNIPDTNNTYAHIVGNGNDINNVTTESNAHTLDWDGNAWFAGTIKIGGTHQNHRDAVEVATKVDINSKPGLKTTNGEIFNDLINNQATGYASHAEGYQTIASGRRSHAEGSNTIASGTSSHAEGDNVKAYGDYSHAEGFGATAYGSNSHAEGQGSRVSFANLTGTGNTLVYTTSKKVYSNSIGRVLTHNKTAAKIVSVSDDGLSITLDKTLSDVDLDNVLIYELIGIAIGNSSHAEGDGTTASGSYSHAEGGATVASGEGSHAEGTGTIASSSNSHAEGYNTKAMGINSHAEGKSTIASSDEQHVQGRYNISDTNNTYAHIVGNGTLINSKITSSNAHTLDWSGNAWFAGDVYAGSTSGTNKDAGSKKLATEEYVTNEVNTLKKSVSDGKSLVAGAITEKGIITAADATFDTMATNISSITTLSSGTSDATIVATDVLNGKIGYGKNGTKVTGTMKNNGAVSATLSANGTYTIPAGYHNGSGKVTQNLTTKGAITYTPTTSNQTIASGIYLTGAQTIKGDSNLKASNIKKGVSIFGVAGTLESSMYDASIVEEKTVIIGSTGYTNLGLSSNYFPYEISIDVSSIGTYIPYVYLNNNTWMLNGPIPLAGKTVKIKYLKTTMSTLSLPTYQWTKIPSNTLLVRLDSRLILPKPFTTTGSGLATELNNVIYTLKSTDGDYYIFSQGPNNATVYCYSI